MKLYDYFRSSAAYRVRIALNLKGVEPENALRAPAQGRRSASQDYLARQSAGPRAGARARRRRACSRSRSRSSSTSTRRIRRRRCCRAARSSVRACAPSRWRSPATSIRSTTCACCTTSKRHARRGRRAEGRVVPVLGRRRLRGARDRSWRATPPTGAFCHGDAPTLADICLVPQLANARRFNVDLAPYPDARCASTRTCRALPAFAAAAPELQPDAE